MPAKATSHEAAQKRIWKAEMKQYGTLLKKTLSDAARAEREAKREVAAAQKKLTASHKKYTATMKRIDKAVPLATADITRRISILEGRINS